MTDVVYDLRNAGSESNGWNLKRALFITVLPSAKTILEGNVTRISSTYPLSIVFFGWTRLAPPACPAVPGFVTDEPSVKHKYTSLWWLSLLHFALLVLVVNALQTMRHSIVFNSGINEDTDAHELAVILLSNVFSNAHTALSIIL